MSVLKFFPVQKLIFGHFWNCKKWNLAKKFREIDSFDFTSFSGLDILKVSGPPCYMKNLFFFKSWNQVSKLTWTVIKATLRFAPTKVTIRYSKNMPVTTATKTNQNHMKRKIFSLIIFWGKTQSPSFFSTVPEAPYLWKVHLVILGNTLAMGSGRSSASNPV